MQNYFLEKEMVTDTSILAWEIPGKMDRGAWQAIVHGITKEADMIQWLNNKNYFYL